MKTETKTDKLGLLENTRNLIRGLERLKGEHDGLLVKLSAEKGCEVEQCQFENVKCHVKYDLVQDSLTKIENGIGEAQFMVTLYNHLIDVEGERCKLQAQVNRLIQENTWLNEELAATQEKLLSSEKNVVQLDEEREHLEYMNSLMHDEIEKFQEELLGPEDEDEAEDDDTFSQPPMRRVSSMFDTANRISTLRALVLQYTSQGRYEVAVPLCNQAIEDLERTSGHEHPDVATMLNILALVYRDQRKYKRATGLLNEALSIRERTLGPDHPAVAATLNNLSVLYGKRGKYEKAEKLCKRALKIREKAAGVNLPDITRQLNNLAHICEKQGKDHEMDTYCQRAMETVDELNEELFTEPREVDPGKDDDVPLAGDNPRVAFVLKNISDIYRRQKSTPVTKTSTNPNALMFSTSETQSPDLLVQETTAAEINC